VRRLIPGVALALLAAGCQAASHAHSTGPVQPVLQEVHPTPFPETTEGPVHALVPHHWAEAPLQEEGSLRQGLMASPDLAQWVHMDGTVPGIEATWVDTTRVGVPSNFLYLAAKWPALPRLASSHTCRSLHQQVIVDHRPIFGRPEESFGDFAARATGTCQNRGRVNRWAYFVAAPSFGPLKQIGLPDSGLYMVVAVIHGGPKAADKLHKVLYGERFGHATVLDLIGAARQSAQLD